MGEAGRGDRSVLLYMVKEQYLQFKEIYLSFEKQFFVCYINHGVYYWWSDSWVIWPHHPHLVSG